MLKSPINKGAGPENGSYCVLTLGYHRQVMESPLASDASSGEWDDNVDLRFYSKHSVSGSSFMLGKRCGDTLSF